MKELLKTFFTNLFRKAAEAPMLYAAVIGGILLAIVIAVCVGGYFTTDAIRTRQYNKKTKENEKLIQAALAEAKKHEQSSLEWEQKAKELAAINAARADLRSKADQQLDQRSDEIIKEQEQISEQIKTQHVNDINTINTMSDDQRAEDICARLKRLAQSNPELADYQCTQ